LFFNGLNTLNGIFTAIEVDQNNRNIFQFGYNWESDINNN
jgi:hypothetical protein